MLYNVIRNREQPRGEYNMKNWKEYETKRGRELLRELETAINNKDKEHFKKVYSVAMRYTKKKERAELMERFLQEVMLCR